MDYSLKAYNEYMANEPKSKKALREACESDLVTFIKYVHPHTVLGSVHEELCDWWTREDAGSHQLVLLPRDHQKSRMLAYRVAWYLTKVPWGRVIYISSTAALAEKQLYFIKNIFEDPKHKELWPFHIHEQEGRREKWTNTEINLDHPLRKKESIRDPSILSGGLGKTLTGFHAEVIAMDDIVVMENAYTEEGREKVSDYCSLLTSIQSDDGEAEKGGGAREWIVGTRYHPVDQYSIFMDMEEEVFNKEGEIEEFRSVYEKFEKKVESRGDGTGEFIWPRQQREDGKWFGFNVPILAKKRAKYINRTQYYAQYYNTPNNPESEAISRNRFQYYEPKHLVRRGGYWYFKERRINLMAAIDFNYSVGKRSDYTALVVVGVDSDRNYYVLDIERFQTDSINRYYEAILNLHIKWDFRKIVCETTAAQQAIVKELRNGYVKPHGLSLSLIEKKPLPGAGSKEERMTAILEPKYDSMSVWHYRGGNCQILEDELIMEHPPHDDVKDALANALEAAIPPTSGTRRSTGSRSSLQFHSRFGGISH